MKTLLTLILTVASLLVSAQCQILGLPTVKVGDSLQLMSDTAAKCNDCYLWKISSEDFLSVQSSAEGKISLEALKAGTVKVSLTVETADGNLTCQRDVEIQNPSQVKEKKCDVEITDFKDVKVDKNTMSFFPNVISQKYSYRWKAFYADGSTKESEEKIPQFTNNPNSVINAVEVQIINKMTLCTSIITRTFGEKVWFPRVEKVEQRRYIQGSYQQNPSKK
ncbi:hypothetical protein [Chryseobacterium caseinilyticum]|uniref:BIG2 domain-containing protein n=1 Tax=Chryseobacterium caseinilyticum TaxID=2771428 RepID=A0ABR8ZFJ1_9FLAO|nr:hypothetical protein [Chryseobacterium caseinilyticum]MBD8084063.1 hypothetical protein [Chryseobacterium caseinilyticum]